MVATGSIRNAPSAGLRHVQAWARQRGAVRLHEVDAYLREVWRLGTMLGYDPAIIAAQSSFATAGWTDQTWKQRLNPAEIGIEEQTDSGIAYSNGVDAARAHLVHLSAFVKGYEPRVRPFIYLDPRWQSVFEAGLEASVSTADDLAGRWSPDPHYGQAVIEHYEGILSAIKQPSALATDGQSGALASCDIHYHDTGNWSERRFGQAPLAIVYHVSGNEHLNQVLDAYRNPVSRSSHHAVVDRDGSLHMLIDAERAAWSNDDIKNPRRDIRWLTSAISENWSRGGATSLNDYTLSVEYVANVHDGATEAQYKTLIALSAFWRDRFNIPVNRGRLIRHSDINSVDRIHCPGAKFALGRVIEALGGSPDDVGS